MAAHAIIRVKGVVQGVGFRYYAHRKAMECNLTGYVKNNLDGSVETEVEGPREMIIAYLQALKIGPAFSRVTDVNIEWLPFENKFNEFRITY